MLKVLSVLGTRPEAIKMAPVIRALADQPDRIVCRVCVTAQHRGMLDQALAGFSIQADHDLNVMTEGQAPGKVAARILERIEPVLAAERPDWVLVQGDTTTTTAAAMAAGYAGLKIAHIEAGLRTYDKQQPFPEEINRLMVTAVAHLHLAPTPGARENLLREGIDPRQIVVTGNPGIDSLLQVIDSLDPGTGRADRDWNTTPIAVPEGRRLVLVTAHRRENHGAPLGEICKALREITIYYGDQVCIVCPVHPKPDVSRVLRAQLGSTPQVVLADPLDYRTLVRLLLDCDLVITDSGGLQEEAPSLGKPVLLMRETTERPEAVLTGNVCMVGTSRHRIVRETIRLLDDRAAYARMSHPVQHYGDGRASARIVAALLGEPVAEWEPELTLSGG